MKGFYKYYNNIHGVIYILLINLTITKHQRIVGHLSSTAKENDLSWVRVMVYILLMITFLWTMGGLYKDPLNLTGYTLLIFSYWLGYHIISQKAIYRNMPPDVELKQFMRTESRYKNSTLTAVEKSEMAGLIGNLMTSEKPYLNNDLTLTSLADKLQMKPIHLSQVLNEEFKENFYGFINRYRVEESKRLLLDPNYSRYSILGIALEAGFNSKTTFNKSFKETTGLSPSEFQVKSMRSS